jgi:hypothetical protein
MGGISRQKIRTVLDSYYQTRIHGSEEVIITFLFFKFMEETSNKFVVRAATDGDIEFVLEIYRYYVENTAISLEWEVPSLEEMKNRFTNTCEKFPYLVCERNQKIVGYAYATSFRTRKGYCLSCENTVYVDKDYKRFIPPVNQLTFAD